jgi:hypothetical protein
MRGLEDVASIRARVLDEVREALRDVGNLDGMNTVAELMEPVRPKTRALWSYEPKMRNSSVRADLLQIFADWGMTTGRGSRRVVDRVLNRHAAELAEKIRAHADADQDYYSPSGQYVAADLIDPGEG